MELRLEPDLIVTHVDTDLDMDHRLVCEDGGGLSGTQSARRSPSSAAIPNTSFWNGHVFPANYYVDITSEIDTEIEAFAVYRSDQKYPHPWSRGSQASSARLHGMQCGCAHAEAYHIIRGHAGLLP